MGSTDSNSRLRIERVEAMDKYSLDIQLSNGNLIVLQTRLILGLPGFAYLAEGNLVLRPETDGGTIHWKNKSQILTVDEILALVGKPDRMEANTELQPDNSKKTVI